MQHRGNVCRAHRAEAGQAAAGDLDQGFLARPGDCGEFSGSTDLWFDRRSRKDYFEFRQALGSDAD
jgi:hypothetical protein